MRSASQYPTNSNVAEKILMFEAKSTILRPKKKTNVDNAGYIVPDENRHCCVPLKAFARKACRPGGPKLVCNFTGAVTEIVSQPYYHIEDVGHETESDERQNANWNKQPIFSRNTCGSGARSLGTTSAFDTNDHRIYGLSFPCEGTFQISKSGFTEIPSEVTSSREDEIHRVPCQFRPGKSHPIEQHRQKMTNAVLEHQDRMNNNNKEIPSHSDTEHDGYEECKSKVMEEYGSDSSDEFLYCDEKCVFCYNSEDSSGISPSSGEPYEDDRQGPTLSPEADDSDEGNSIDFTDIPTTSNKSGSVKRSCTALRESHDDDHGSSEYNRSSTKRFRKNDTQGSHEVSDESPDESPFAASSYTMEGAFRTPPSSPLAGQQAEYSYEYGKANLPDDPPRALTHCCHKEADHADFVNFSHLFGYPDHYLPFQLHPTHNEDLGEYYNFMRRKELISHPSNCLRNQSKIRKSMRKILVEWLTKISHHYKLSGQSLHLTVNVLDRYTDRQKEIYRGHYQLLGVTSLLVATKQLEVDIPPVATCLMLCRNLYSKTQLLSLEQHLLDSLEFDLNVPTAHTFLDYYVISQFHSNMGITEFDNGHRDAGVPYLKKLLCLSRCLLDYGLADYDFCQYFPSLAARASMEIAKEMILAKDEKARWSHSYGTDIGQPRFYRYGMNFNRLKLRTSRTQPGNVSSSCDPTCSSYERDLHGFKIEECASALCTLVGTEKLTELQNSMRNVIEKYSFE